MVGGAQFTRTSRPCSTVLLRGDLNLLKLLTYLLTFLLSNYYSLTHLLALLYCFVYSSSTIDSLQLVSH